MSAGRLAAVAAGALGGLAVFAGVALAGYPVDSHNEGRAKGLSYRSAVSYFAGSGGVTATCPDGRVITGGGAALDGATADASLEVLGPNFLADGTSYKRGFSARGDVNGLGQELSAYAICAQRDGLTFKRETAGYTTPDELFVAKARCPGRTHVVGGGFDTDGYGDAILASAPRDGGDADSKPDDGWLVRFIADFSVDPVRVTAICSDDRHLAYRQESTSAGTGEQLKTALCPNERAVTGGGTALSGDANAFIHNSQPADFGDADNTTPEDGWAAKAYVSSGSQSLTTYAICKR